MITKHVFGKPVFTGAVVEKIEVEGMPFGTVKSQWPFEWNFTMGQQDVVYGLGESMGGMNKRGSKFTSWCSDEPNQTETKESIYGAHNFLLIKGAETFGIFFDTASRVHFDIGWTNPNLISVTLEQTGVNVYTITSEKSDSILTDITTQFRRIIGQSYIPPEWALGFQQSRWGYRTEQDIREVAELYKKNNLPLSAICMDIDYMKDYEDFTVDGNKFPDLKQLASDLKKDGIHLVPIIDAGVKVKPGYSVYEEGVKNNYFCKRADGTDYVAGVWPGHSHFPDFFRADVRKWFGQKYKVLADAGIDGFWNDMNEPAMFYSEEKLAEVHKKMKETDVSNLDIISFFEFASLGESLKNSMDDYKRFYNQVEDENGNVEIHRHDEVHNYYGTMMTRAASEELQKLFPNEKKLLYSRASAIGAHRYGGIWTGDCQSWWSHLELQIKMLPGLNMCGFLYSGSDIGGFGDNTNRELTLRWTQLGVFTPLMRNHSADGTRRQEFYLFENVEDFRNLLEFRYALIPYLYSEFLYAAQNDSMLFRPLSFDFENDSMALQCEDQLMFARDLMIAPVYHANSKGRYVYLPEDMTQVTWKKSCAEQKLLSKGIHFVEMPLDSLVFFVRKNRTVQLGQISIGK